MQCHILFVVECPGLLFAVEKVQHADLVLSGEHFKARVAYVLHAVQFHQHTCQVPSSCLMNRKWFPTVNSQSVFQCFEPIVGIPHVPMEPDAVLVVLGVDEEVFKHAFFQSIVMVVKFNFPVKFSILVNRKGLCIFCRQIANRDRSNPRRLSFTTIVKTLARIMNHENSIRILADLNQLFLSLLTTPSSHHSPPVASSTLATGC